MRYRAKVMRSTFEGKEIHMLLGAFELFIIIIGMALVIVVPFWRIFSKAGFPGALSLLMLIPLVNLVMIFVLAFADWPALKEKQQ